MKYEPIKHLENFNRIHGSEQTKLHDEELKRNPKATHFPLYSNYLCSSETLKAGFAKMGQDSNKFNALGQEQAEEPNTKHSRLNTCDDTGFTEIKTESGNQKLKLILHLKYWNHYRLKIDLLNISFSF